MKILIFIIANWDSVLIVLVAAAVLAILYKRGRVEIVKKIIYAERN